VADVLATAEASLAGRSRAIQWTAAIVAGLGLIPVAILALGLAAVVWVPLLAGLAAVMWSVWIARRRRQMLQNRNDDEVKNPAQAEAPWPKGVVDDRLPEP
jgi:hypothetical protein